MSLDNVPGLPCRTSRCTRQSRTDARCGGKDGKDGEDGEEGVGESTDVSVSDSIPVRSVG